MPTFSGSKKPLPLAILVVSIALVLAACGSSSPSVAHLGSRTKTSHPTKTAPSSGGPGLSTSTDTGQGSGARVGFGVAGPGGAAKALKFSQCMRSHGEPTFPDPGSGGSTSFTPSSTLNPRSPQFQQAQTKCGTLISGGGTRTPAERAEGLAQALRFSQCMRSHGVPSFPDPQSTGDGAVSLKLSAGNGLDPSSPAFQAAQKTCQSKLPGGAPTSARP